MGDRDQSQAELLAEVIELRARVAAFGAEARGAPGVTGRPEQDPRLAAILGTALDAIVSMDKNGDVTEFNVAAERLFGYRRDEIVGRHLADYIIPHAHREAHRNGLAKFLETGVGPVLNRRIEITALTAAGAEIPVELAITPFHADGQWLFTAYIRDISERKAAEKRLAVQYTVARVLSEVATLDAATPLVLEAVCETVGWDLGQLWQFDAHANVLRFAAARHQPPAACEAFIAESRAVTFVPGSGLPGAVWATRRQRWISDVEYDRTIVRADVAKRCGLRAAAAFPVMNGDEVFGVMEFFQQRVQEPDEAQGAMLAAVASQFGQFVARSRAQDALRESEAQLAQSQKMEAVGQLAGGVAHDFNNLLTIISGNAELLHSQLSNDITSQELVAEIRAAGSRATSLVRQLLTFSSKHAFELRTVDPTTVVRETEGMLRRLIDSSVVLESELDPRAGHVRVSPGHVEQVLMNLAVNARAAMPDGGRLTIRVEAVELDATSARRWRGAAPGRYVKLEVRDTGHGMSPDTAARAFEPFFTTKAGGTSSGLGLSVVHGIVQQSGGHVELDSTVGHGTTFTILLPKVEPPRSVGQVRDVVDEVSRGSETILLAEDESAVRRLALRVLRAAGYDVLEASDGNDALRVAAATPKPVQLLLTDVVMPGLGGRELAERLTAANPELKVLFMSGYSDDVVLRAGVFNRQVAFLQKPFTGPSLTLAVRAILDR